MKKTTCILLLLWGIVVLWMGCIFALSAETAAESSNTSGTLLRSILAFFDEKFVTYSEAEQTALVERYSFLIRKTAHFCIYAALGFFTSNALVWQRKTTGKPKTKVIPVLSIFIGGLYAVSDEIHQAFVPGRSCEVRDMLIDTTGVILGVVCSLLLVYLITKHKKQHKPL